MSFLRVRMLVLSETSMIICMSLNVSPCECDPKYDYEF